VARPSSRPSKYSARQRDALGFRFQALQNRRFNGMRQRLNVFFRQQSARVIARYTGTKTATLDLPVWMGPSVWGRAFSLKAMQDDLLPPDEDRRLQIVIQPDLQEQYIAAATLAGGLLGGSGPSPDDPRVQDYLLTSGERIVAINDATRDDVRLALALGGERGYNQHQIARGVPDEGFRGLDDIVAQTYRGRSDTIVRTELAFSSARATLDSYDEVDVDEVDVLDGDGCGWTDHDDPDIADGSRRTMDEADEYPIAHPNCVRVFLPVLG
jgi:hypothetical protein